jgi:uncharacterized protein (TIGR01777 family)
MKTIGITGGTGFVGQHLTRLLTEKGYHVVVFTRNIAIKSHQPGVSYAHWNSDVGECDNNAIRSLDAMVHLAGAGLADKRWTDERKKKIVESRVNVTDFLVSLLRAHGSNCKAFISASAIGYYGADKNGTAFRESDPPGTDFLADTCVKWEHASFKAAEFTRTCVLRFGIVLGKEGGAFPKFAGPMVLGVMPILGDGGQIISWIEISDLAHLILYAIENHHMSGVYNAVAPQPVSNKELMLTIAKVKGGFKDTCTRSGIYAQSVTRRNEPGGP